MKQVLAGVKSWAAFQKIAATLGPQGKGDIFELLTKHFLLLNPTYNTTLSDVWLLDEVPEKLRASLQLPQSDQGKNGGLLGHPMQVSHGQAQITYLA